MDNPKSSRQKEHVQDASGRQENLALVAEVQSLRTHKEWADKKIDQLIKRVRDAEGPQRLLKEEVQQLRLVRLSRQSKLRDCTMTYCNLVRFCPVPSDTASRL